MALATSNSGQYSGRSGGVSRPKHFGSSWGSRGGGGYYNPYEIDSFGYKANPLTGNLMNTNGSQMPRNTDQARELMKSNAAMEGRATNAAKWLKINTGDMAQLREDFTPAAWDTSPAALRRNPQLTERGTLNLGRPMTGIDELKATDMFAKPAPKPTNPYAQDELTANIALNRGILTGNPAAEETARKNMADIQVVKAQDVKTQATPPSPLAATGASNMVNGATQMAFGAASGNPIAMAMGGLESSMGGTQLGTQASANLGRIPTPPPPPVIEDKDKKAKGGPTKSMNPYLVGEEGPEIYVPKQGQPEVIGAQGPEIRTFGQKGEIIPNHKIKPRFTGGGVAGSAALEKSKELTKSKELADALSHLSVNELNRRIQNPKASEDERKYYREEMSKKLKRSLTLQKEDGDSFTDRLNYLKPVADAVSDRNDEGKPFNWFSSLNYNPEEAPPEKPKPEPKSRYNLFSFLNPAEKGEMESPFMKGVRDIAKGPREFYDEASATGAYDSFTPVKVGEDVATNPAVSPTSQPLAAASPQRGFMNPLLEAYQSQIGKMRSMYPSAMGVPIANQPPSPGESLSVAQLGARDKEVDVARPAINDFMQRNPYYDDITAVRSRMAAPIQTQTAHSFGEAPSDTIALSKPLATKQEFSTPYGKIGVSFGQKQPSMIEGVPTQQFFQQAANRQGEANKFATPVNPLIANPKFKGTDQDPEMQARYAAQRMANDRSLENGFPLRKIEPRAKGGPVKRTANPYLNAR